MYDDSGLFTLYECIIVDTKSIEWSLRVDEIRLGTPAYLLKADLLVVEVHPHQVGYTELSKGMLDLRFLSMLQNAASPGKLFVTNDTDNQDYFPRVMISGCTPRLSSVRLQFVLDPIVSRETWLRSCNDAKYLIAYDDLVLQAANAQELSNQLSAVCQLNARHCHIIGYNWSIAINIRNEQIYIASFVNNGNDEFFSPIQKSPRHDEELSTEQFMEVFNRRQLE